MTEGLLLMVSAPSGAGKTSLISALVAHCNDKNANSGHKMVVSVSHTTRSRRPKEQDGVDYYFVDCRAFENMVDAGEFLEHAKVFGNRYGTSRKAVSEELARGNDVVLEIDWQGAKMIRKEFPRTLDIFVLPPSRAELANRLKVRATDDPAVIERRMNEARREISHYEDYANLVVNEHFEEALSRMVVIVESARSGKRPPPPDVQRLLDELLSQN